MVQYEGYVNSDGELVVHMEGNSVSLREFLEAKRLKQSESGFKQGERRRSEDGRYAVAK